jgi:sugar/nucleoside kinase (ribokinase family)
LAAAVGDDVWGSWCWEVLEREGVDLSRSRRFAGWPTPLTVAMSVGHDRALLSHAAPPPLDTDELVGDPPASRAAVVHLEPEPLRWVKTAAASGALVFAEVGWDPSRRWTTALLDQLQVCHAFVPNEAEAMSYTRTSDARSAVAKLAELVPLAVITRGPSGALGIDAATGETAEVAGIPVEVVDATGAGDVFTAALVTGTLLGWTLRRRLAFANLCAALAVRRPGAAIAAPGWADIQAWWAGVRRSSGEADLRHEYAFLDDVVRALSQD